LISDVERHFGDLVFGNLREGSGEMSREIEERVKGDREDKRERERERRSEPCGGDWRSIGIVSYFSRDQHQ
jgi:hypothetical protein